MAASDKKWGKNLRVADFKIGSFLLLRSLSAKCQLRRGERSFACFVDVDEKMLMLRTAFLSFFATSKEISSGEEKQVTVLT